MYTYTHKVAYYETDKMGLTHHSNYIRWMEEARVDMFEKAGAPYDALEEKGVYSPVTRVEVDYVKSTTYPDTVTIETKITEFRGVRLKVSYLMKNAAGETVCRAKSEHCFLDGEGKLIRVKRDDPELYDTLYSLVEEE